MKQRDTRIYTRVRVAQLLAKQLCVVLLCHVCTCKILQAAQHWESATIQIVCERIETLFARTEKAA